MQRRTQAGHAASRQDVDEEPNRSIVKENFRREANSTSPENIRLKGKKSFQRTSGQASRTTRIPRSMRIQAPKELKGNAVNSQSAITQPANTPLTQRALTWPQNPQMCVESGASKGKIALWNWGLLNAPSSVSRCRITESLRSPLCTRIAVKNSPNHSFRLADTQGELQHRAGRCVVGLLLSGDLAKSWRSSGDTIPYTA